MGGVFKLLAMHLRIAQLRLKAGNFLRSLVEAHTYLPNNTKSKRIKKYYFLWPCFTLPVAAPSPMYLPAQAKSPPMVVLPGLAPSPANYRLPGVVDRLPGPRANVGIAPIEMMNEPL